MALSQSDLYTLALGANLSPSAAKIAAAVGMAESGGNPNAHNTNASTGDNSYGLWQINMIGKLEAERLRQFGISRNGRLLDPKTNARAMAKLSARGTDWHDWSTFRHGAHLKFLGNPVKDNSSLAGWLQKILPGGDAVAQAGAATGGAAHTAVEAAGQAVELATKAGQWVSNSQNQVRVAYVIGGGIVVIVATVVIIRSTAPGRSLERGAKKAAKTVVKVAAPAPVKKAAKVATKATGKAAA